MVLKSGVPCGVGRELTKNWLRNGPFQSSSRAKKVSEGAKSVKRGLEGECFSRLSSLQVLERVEAQLPKKVPMPSLKSVESRRVNTQPRVQHGTDASFFCRYGKVHIEVVPRALATSSHHSFDSHAGVLGPSTLKELRSVFVTFSRLSVLHFWTLFLSLQSLQTYLMTGVLKCWVFPRSVAPTRLQTVRWYFWVYAR